MTREAGRKKRSALKSELKESNDGGQNVGTRAKRQRSAASKNQNDHDDEEGWPAWPAADSKSEEASSQMAQPVECGTTFDDDFPEDEEEFKTPPRHRVPPSNVIRTRCAGKAAESSKETKKGVQILPPPQKPFSQATVKPPRRVKA